MKLNGVILDETEKDILTSASKIASKIQQDNIYSCGAEDDYLSEQCIAIMRGIADLLTNIPTKYKERRK